MKRIILVMLFVFLLVGCDSDNKSASDKINNAVETKEIDTQNEDSNLEQDGVNITRMNSYTADDNGYCANFDVVKFGSYEQDGDESNGTEAIEWYVIAKEDGKALLFSKYILDNQLYDEFQSSDYSVGWENSYIRTWLNEDFYNKSFISDEKELIIESTLKNKINRSGRVEEDSETKDNVFILSIDEMALYFELLYDDGNMYASEDLFSVPTKVLNDYYYPDIYDEELYQTLSEKYGYKNEDVIGTNQGYFWVRSPGDDCVESKICMSRVGIFGEDSSIICDSNIGVRPAIWVDEAALTMYQ